MFKRSLCILYTNQQRHFMYSYVLKIKSCSQTNAREQIDQRLITKRTDKYKCIWQGCLCGCHKACIRSNLISSLTLSQGGVNSIENLQIRLISEIQHRLRKIEKLIRKNIGKLLENKEIKWKYSVVSIECKTNYFNILVEILQRRFIKGFSIWQTWPSICGVDFYKIIYH